MKIWVEIHTTMSRKLVVFNTIDSLVLFWYFVFKIYLNNLWYVVLRAIWYNNGGLGLQN